MTKCLIIQREQVKTKGTKIQSGLCNRIIARIKIFNFLKAFLGRSVCSNKFVRYLETLA